MAKGKYQEWLTGDGLLLLRAWARDGLTDENIADKIGISVSTLYAWKSKFPELSEALKKGKEPVDIEVENALLGRALGMHYTETKTLTTRIILENGEPSPAIREETTTIDKYALPDTTAQIFWLRNRKRNRWSNKPESENIDNTVHVVIDKDIEEFAE